MTEQITAAGPQHEARQLRPLRPVGRLVHERVTHLQRMAGKPGTIAVLAQLRGAVGRPPGAVPAVWALTLDGVPGARLDDSVPSYEEWAVHTALTLYALHQQARANPMHERGVGLGEAVAKLDRAAARDGRLDSDRPSATRRRFDQIATATSFDEVTYHLRGLIGLLRQAKLQISLDYGQLADDLLALQIPSRAAGVRLAWARQYYRTSEQAPENQSEASADSEGHTS